MKTGSEENARGRLSVYEEANYQYMIKALPCHWPLIDVILPVAEEPCEEEIAGSNEQSPFLLVKINVDYREEIMVNGYKK
jgi:hypothetical protein